MDSSYIDKEQVESVIYADDMEPVHTEWGELYLIRLPRLAERKSSDTVQAFIAVHKDGYCELWKWYYFGTSKTLDRWHLSIEEDRIQYETQQKVWDWLAEWELVELRPIGPEDKEYFATDKLTKSDNSDW